MRAAGLLGVTLTVLLCWGCSKQVVQGPERSKIYVLGSVNQQIMIEYRDGMTLLEALSYANFPDNDAIKMYVRWVDKSGGVIRKRHFSYGSLITGGSNNEPVHPGDIVYVYRNPIYVVLDVLERFLQPIRSIFAPATSTAATVTTGGAGP